MARSGLLGRLALVCAAAVLALFPVQSPAQGTATPGANVNMVSGTGWPGGDPFLQRQNEPSIAASSRNPLHLFAVANDYRAVDLPGILGGEENGDAWLGIFTSLNGGLSWNSTLLPGCPYNIPDCSGAPAIQGFQAASDPTLRAGTNGLFYLSGIAFNRGTNAPGAVFVSRFIDNNDKEAGNPIKFSNLIVVDSGTSGQFLDKPWLAVDMPRTGAGVCTVPQDAGGTSFPAGNAYLVYSRFVGSDLNNPHSQIMFTRSLDCGQSWSTPSKLSESYSVNQGTVMAINPVTGDVYVVWRQIQNNSGNVPDSIVFAKSSDQGKTFSKATVIATISPFDQDDAYTSFRTRAFPAMAVDGNGVIYLAWSQRGVGPNGDARIVMTTSTDTKKWSTPFPVDNPAGVRGHQIMPALAVGGGKVMVTYYDLREDHTVGVFTGLGGGLFSEQRTSSCTQGSPNCDSTGQVFSSNISDAGLYRRHTMDVRVTQANIGASPTFDQPSTRVSRYTAGSVPADPSTIKQLQFNPPNLPMFQQGQLPFMGDYIDLAPSVQFVQDSSGNWQYNTSSVPVFHAVWTDNRDVRPPGDGNWANYKVPASAFTSSYGVNSLYDPTQVRPLCVDTAADAAQTGIRNQNIYTARITQGLIVGTLGDSKPLLTPSGAGITRAFVVFAQNNADQVKTYAFNIQAPTSVQASFLPPGQVLTSSVTVQIAARSTVSRTVYASSTAAKYVPVIVTVTDPTNPNLIYGVISLDSDPSNPGIANPDGLNTADIQNLEVYNADISEAQLQTRALNPDIVNPDIVNPDIVNPDIVNPDIVNPDIVNPDIVNPDIVNASIINPDIVNTTIANPDIVNTPITDATWTVTNAGNTATSYSVKLLAGSGNLPPGAKLQLLITKVPTAPLALPDSCNLQVQGQNVLVASIPNPTLLTDPAQLQVSSQDTTASGIQNVTLALSPGEVGKITLRIVGISAADAASFFQQSKVGVGTQVSPLALIITSLSLPAGVYGSPYSQQIQAAGGTGTRTWTLLNDNSSLTGLPAGLSLSSDGTLSGTPSGTGTFTFKVKVTDTGDPTKSIVGERDIQVLTLVVNKAVASLSLSNLMQTYTGLPIQASVITSPLGLAGVSVTYDGSTTAPVNAGSYAVVATLTNPSYQASPAAGTLVISPAVQSISFGVLPSLAYGTAPFTLSASASSGLPVTYSATGNCTVSGNTVTLTSAGSCTITASQAGNGNYTSAPSVTQTFAINKAGTATAITSDLPDPSYAGQSVTVTFTVVATASGIGTPTGGVTVSAGALSCTASVSVGGCSLAPTTAGTLTLTATYSGDASFAASSGSASHSVQPFTFIGLLSPLKTAGSITAPSNSGSFNLGKAIPIKWQLKNPAGNFVTNQVPNTLLTVVPNAACSGAGTGTPIVLWPSATGSTVLRYDTTNNQYVFNWDTTYQPAGCYNIQVQLIDGTARATIVKIQ